MQLLTRLAHLLVEAAVLAKHIAAASNEGLLVEGGIFDPRAWWNCSSVGSVGDGWEHTIKVERIENVVPGLTSPFLVDAVGRCPPQDVGGPSGYEELLEIVSDIDCLSLGRELVGARLSRQ
jgi:hypothetical protein